MIHSFNSRFFASVLLSAFFRLRMNLTDFLGQRLVREKYEKIGEDQPCKTNIWQEIPEQRLNNLRNSVMSHSTPTLSA